LGVSDCLLFLSSKLSSESEVFDQICLEWRAVPPLSEKKRRGGYKMKFSSFPSWKSAVLERLAMKSYSFARPNSPAWGPIRYSDEIPMGDDLRREGVHKSV